MQQIFWFPGISQTHTAKVLELEISAALMQYTGIVNMIIRKI